MKKSLLSLLFASLLPSASVFAEMDVWTSTNHDNAEFTAGEPIIIYAQPRDEKNQPVGGRTVKYQIIGDGGLELKGKFVSDAAKPFAIKTKLDFPGALRTEFTLLDEKGKPIPAKKKLNQRRFITGYVGAVVDKDKLIRPFPVPKDFNAYWAEQRKLLDTIPVKELSRKLHLTKDGVNIYDVRVSCYGGRVVSGYLGVPVGAKPKSLPAIAIYRGAGVGKNRYNDVMRRAKQGFISLAINAHGIENDGTPEYYQKLKDGELARYYFRCYETLEDHYFRGMCIRVMRSLDYLKTLPEWNGKDLVVNGGSQGGYQSLVAAGLDKQVTLCFATVPAFSDFYGEFFGNPKRMKRLHFGNAMKSRSDKDKLKLLNIQAYLDTACFAENITCPTYITVGFCDLSSPTTSVFGVYNAIPNTTFKRIKTFPNGMHGSSIRFDEAEAAISAIAEKINYQFRKKSARERIFSHAR